MSRKRQSSGQPGGENSASKPWGGGQSGDWLFTNDVVFRVVGRPVVAEVQPPASSELVDKPGGGDASAPRSKRRSSTSKAAPAAPLPKSAGKTAAGKPRRARRGKTPAPTAVVDPSAATAAASLPIAKTATVVPEAAGAIPPVPASMETTAPSIAPAPPPARVELPSLFELGPRAAKAEAVPIEVDEQLPKAVDESEVEESWPPKSGWFRLASRISTAATVVLVIGIVWLALSFILRDPVDVGEEVETANDETAELPQTNAVASNDEAGSAPEPPPVRVIGDPWPTSSGANNRATPASPQSSAPTNAGVTAEAAPVEENLPAPLAEEIDRPADPTLAEPIGPARRIEATPLAPSPEPARSPDPGSGTTAGAAQPDPAAPLAMTETDDAGQPALQTPASVEPSETEPELSTPQVPQPLPRPAPPPEPEFAAVEPDTSDVDTTGTVLPGNGAGPRIVVHVPSTGRAAFSNRLSGALRSIGEQVEVREVGIDSRVSRVRYFYPDDRAAAQAVRRAVAASGGDWNVDLSDFTHYRPLPRRGTIEVWLTAGP